ncbi:hypothetical protein FJ970_32340 (plasmid) [Mesorhizobium sp. B2-1-8]|nr:hypothetical protein [Mesorhizobium sp. B2-1-8]UCI22626.1 hypothetical protein FJ970_32340 [Mesorhizobium sp. B2-1-8]
MNYGIEHRFMDAAGVLFDFGAADPDPTAFASAKTFWAASATESTSALG